MYIDGFAGAGRHISKETGEFVPGSPLNALRVEPPFREYHFIDLNPAKAGYLKETLGGEKGVHVYEGDCHQTLLTEVFPQVRYEDYRRALCVLDPYGLHLDWEVIRTAGRMESIEIFLNFPVADMNRNVFRKKRDLSEVDPKDIDRMNAFGGDDSWKDVAFERESDLFGHPQKTDHETVAEAFRVRLRKVAGFKYVPTSLPMRNTRNAVLYYLFFAAQKPEAKDIVEDIMAKYRV